MKSLNIATKKTIVKKIGIRKIKTSNNKSIDIKTLLRSQSSLKKLDEKKVN
jgi:hypothetical protein